MVKLLILIYLISDIGFESALVNACVMAKYENSIKKRGFEAAVLLVTKILFSPDNQLISS